MIQKNIGSDVVRPAETPYQRPHDKWQDIVVQADAEDDHVIVRRVPSLRWRRGMFTLSITALTFGILMVVFSTPSIRNDVLAPGGLCSAHAQILAGQGADRCAACHPAGNQSFSSWVSTTVWGSPSDQPTQSELCMKCHEQTLSVDFALNPHSVDPAILKKKSDAISFSTASQLDSFSRVKAPIHDGKIACSVCHREHHGDQRDLKSLTDAQCQSCHKNVFLAFETDHPPFTGYPAGRRSKIAFDHASHFGKHFPANKKEFACAQCHISGLEDVVQAMAPFEQACAECHQQGIDASSESGLALIALPTLDVVAIEKQNASIGSWPLAATGEFDGPLPPLMRILLNADPQAATVLAKKDVHFDFSDLDPGVSEDVADGVTLVWAIKRLMFELARDGQAAIARRIQIVTNKNIEVARLSNLLETLDSHALRNAAQRWMPDLQQEVGEQVPVYEASMELQQAFESFLAAQPQRENFPKNAEMTLAKVISNFSRQQQQRRIDADDSQWLAVNPLKEQGRAVEPQVNVSGRKTQQKPILQTIEDVHSRNGPIQRSEAVVKRLGPKAKSIVNSHLQQSNRDNSEWLAENPLATDAGVNNVVVPTKKTINVPEKIADKFSPKKKLWPNELPPRKLGWIRDDSIFQLRYQPSGHADPIIKNWIELVGELPEIEATNSLRPAFDRLLATGGIGDCRRCHTVDRIDDRSLQVNWKAKYRDPSMSDFTKFSHGPHLTLLELRDCSRCHQLENERSTTEQYAGFDGSQSGSNFATMKVSDCAACHRSGSAGNNCTQCHNYHVSSDSNCGR